MPRGAVSQFTQEIAETIIENLANGKTLSETAAIVGFTVSTIQRWRLEDASFQTKCSHALSLGIEVRVDSMQEIAKETPDVNRARLLVDVIKWEASKRKPDVYGDRIELNVNQTVDVGSALLAARARVLLPMRFQSETLDAETIDVPALTDNSSTGSKPVASIEMDRAVVQEPDKE